MSRKTARLSPRERALALFEGDTPDRIPIAPTIDNAIAPKILGITQLEYSKPDSVIKLARYNIEKLHADIVNIPFSAPPWASMGISAASKLLYEMPRVRDGLFKKFRLNEILESLFDVKLEEMTNDNFVLNYKGTRTYIPKENPIAIRGPPQEGLKSLKRPDELVDYTRFMSTKPIETVKKMFGDEVVVCGYCPVGIGVLYNAMDLKDILMLFYKDRNLLKSLLEKTADLSIELGKRAIDAGADVIWVTDPPSSCTIISPKNYFEFCYPVHEKVIKAVQKAGAYARYHVCGYIEPILPYVKEIGADVIDIDMGKTDWVRANYYLGKKSTTGGVNPLDLMNEDPNKFGSILRRNIEGINKPFILSNVDSAPLNTKLDNLMLIHKIADKYGRL